MSTKNHDTSEAISLSAHPLRVASPHYGWGNESVSGGGVYERELMARIGEFGVSVQALLAPGGSYVAAPGIRCRQLNRRFPLDSSSLGFLRALADEYRRDPFEIIRAHDTGGPLSASAAFSALYADLPVIVHVHHLETLGRARTKMLRFLLSRSDHIIVGSRFTAEQLIRRLQLSEKRITVIRNGVDPEKYLPAPTEVRGKGPDLLFVGGLVPRKNLFLLVEIVRRLKHRHAGIKLVIIGKGYLEEDLRKRIRRASLESNIRIITSAGESDKIRLLQTCSVFVFPSHLEGFGFAPAEAMACGTPVVTTDGSALRELVRDGETGFLCPSDDADAFAAAIARLLEDRALVDQIGANARDYIIRNHDWSDTASKVAAVYRCVAEGRDVEA